MRKRISKYKHLHSNRFRYWCSSIPLVCASGLIVVLGMMISPISRISEIGVDGEAYAATVVTGGATTSDSVSLSLVNPEVTSLQASATSGTVAYITKDFTITSSNEYNIYVQTSNGNSNLTNRVASIPSLTGSNIAPSNFSDNTWGYTVADNAPDPATLTYNSVPASSSSAIKSGSNANNKAFRLAFAAKFGDSATAGHYRTDIVLSVAANPGEVTSGFGGIEYMDELTPDICKIATVGDTTQLIDWRDRKPYWVAKLKDNNCWMTQNLDYDDPNSTRVSLPSAWTSTDASYRSYYDPGNYYFTNASSWTACSNNGTGLSACTGNGWTTSGDAHYHAGNYYSWQAATNGTGSSATTNGATASGSICPAGWQLPSSNNTNSGSFGGLISGLGTGATWANAITSAPYYFVTGGYVSGGTLGNVGSQGRYWSSTASDSTNAFLLSFTSSAVDPSGTYARRVGYSVRCLVQVPEEITYTLSYDIRGGSNPPATQTVTTSADSYTFTVANGDTVTPPASSAFLGWSTAGNYPSYASGSTITLTKDEPNKTLYAVWGYLGLD